MATVPYADVLEKARADLAQARADRYELDSRIERLERTVRALTSLVEQPALDPAKGITEGIKVALQLVAPGGLYPTTLRLQLEKAGFDFSQQKNPMASIHAILKRLQRRGLVHIKGAKDPKSGYGYFWVIRKPDAKESAVKRLRAGASLD